MKCRELMTMDLRWVRETATVREAAALMRDNSIGFLPVCTDEARLVGVVTDRDLAVRVCAENRIAEITPVADVMTREPTVCEELETVSAAEKRMIENKLARLPVLGPGDNVVGVLSLADIISKRRATRALKTARGVLSRESDGPHTPIADIQLTPSDPNAPTPDPPHRIDDLSRTSHEGLSFARGRSPGVY